MYPRFWIWVWEFHFFDVMCTCMRRRIVFSLFLICGVGLHTSFHLWLNEKVTTGNGSHYQVPLRSCPRDLGAFPISIS